MLLQLYVAKLVSSTILVVLSSKIICTVIRIWETEVQLLSLFYDQIPTSAELKKIMDFIVNQNKTKQNDKGWIFAVSQILMTLVKSGWWRSSSDFDCEWDNSPV